MRIRFATSRYKLALPHPARRGFALLLTLMLLAFVVLLLVGLATYTRVETAIAGNVQRQSQARENARLAFSVALAQLQRHAGPDQRVTATAKSTAAAHAQKRHYTGVWDSSVAGTEPVAWLASGSETNVPLDIAAGIPAARRVILVGRNSDDSATEEAIVAALQDITAPGVPGHVAGSDPVIGRCAWWVGDQGVKAAVALADNSGSLAYAPYDSAELRSRLRQQISLGAGAVNAAGAPIIESRDSNNAPLLAEDRVMATNQIAFLRDLASEPLGAARLRTYFHAWSPNNLAVLASTAPRSAGLRRDISIDPTVLGPAFAAWANYDPATGGYMEPPGNPASPAPLPGFAADPLRRRYMITAPDPAGGAGVRPVLTYFYLLFGVRKQTAAAPYTLSLRWSAALWNPYTSALVPEDLRMEISGLPESVVTTVVNPSTGASANDITLNLRQLYEPFAVTLPWTPSVPAIPSEQSWLPGRVYNWTYLPNASPQSGGEYPGRFDSRHLGAFAAGVTRTVSGSSSVNGNSPLALRVTMPTTLTVKLTRKNGDLLATYTSPTYDAVPITEPGPARGDTSQLGFLFRLAESIDTVATPDVWLATPGRDPRSEHLPPESLLALPFGTNPAAYRNYVTTRAPSRFLDRDITQGRSYNENVPLFELPRAPLLSLGELQHMYLPGARPYSIGNSWGGGTSINGIGANELFDRFYFSGLAAGMMPSAMDGALRLPNPTLKVIPRNSETGAAVTLADLLQAPNARSSKFLLQGGAFNLNSTNATAWAAVLRGVRFPAPSSFTYLDADPLTGSAADTATQSWQSTNAHFFRFAQSAQEVFKADDDYVQSTPSDEEEVLGTALFRRGIRTLPPERLWVLATKIADAIGSRHAAAGPFRTLEAFLSPASPGAPGLLESAIAAAGINASVPEFSSQWLTQADIMTALAPSLFARSDTFMIRAYGEAVNPATGATEGRAWCEAMVQRVPDYFDRSQPAETPPDQLNELNTRYGRRFKVVSFRWLTRSDI